MWPKTSRAIQFNSLELEQQSHMKVTQEKLPNSQVGLEIEVPADISKQTYEQTLRKYMKTANIPGFRKGKVPRQILVQQLGATEAKGSCP